MEEAQAQSEGLMRAILRGIPDGTYAFDEFLDDDGIGDRPYRIHVAVTIAGDSATVDFTGTSPQAAGPMNSSYGNTLSSTFNALLQLTGPEVPFNAGCFRPIEMIAPRGCLLNPVPPAPCFGGVTEVSIRIIDAILGALAPVARDRAGAGSYGTCLSFSGGGFDAERGQTFAFYFFTEGGWGACAWRDGWNVTPNPTSNFTDYPIEWLESTLPLRFTEVRLNTDSGGAGRHRGGVGVVRSFEVAADAVEINALGERFRISPFGLGGGAPGGLNALLVRTGKDEEWRSVSEAFGTVSPSKFHGVKAGSGLHFSMVTGGGGGYGRAIERSAQEVVRDVEYGYVSISGAQTDYGVVIAEEPDGRLIADEAATAALRASGRTAADDSAARHRVKIEAALEQAAVAGSAQVEAEVTAVTALIERALGRIRQSGVADTEAAPGRSLRNPFLNDRALAYWDTDALTRWASRHRFRIE
jgi:N-methylhydantoinase B/oxoprolinase/acetone carboxylase alpha subunit